MPWPAPSFFHTRQLMCLTIAYMLGIVASRMLAYGVWCWMMLAGLLLLALATRAWPRVQWRLVLACLLLFGIARGGMAMRAPQMPPLGKWSVEGTIDGEVDTRERAVLFVLRDVRVRPEEGAGWQPLAGKLYCYCPTESVIGFAHGQRIAVAGTAYRPNEARNPGGFDQRMWLAQKGAHMRLYASTTPTVLEAARPSIQGIALGLNQTIGARMDRLFGEASPVIRAMVLGDQRAMPDEWAQWLRESSVAHLLAVSGLHVGLWFLLLNRLTRRIPLTEAERWGMLALLLGLYALLTGLKASVLRAVVMLLAVQGARMARRKPDPLTTLSLAALLLLLVRPLDLFAAGFQLSFCAVLGIVLLRPLMQRIPFVSEGVGNILRTSMAAQLGIMPAASRWFSSVAAVSILLNLAAIPLAGLLIPVAAAATLLDAIWAPLGWVLVQASRGMVAVFLWMAKATSALTLASLPMGAFAWWTACAFGACVFLCCTAVVWRWRRRFAAMGLVVVLALGIGLARGSFWVRYVQLDVGQALAGVLHVGRATYVYDTGDVGSDLTEYLLYSGSTVDGLFLSHPHLDHVGGLAEVLEADIPIGTVFVPVQAGVFGMEPGYEEKLALAQAKGAQIVELAQGDILRLNGVTATVIAPEAEVRRGNDPNDRSLVVLMEIGRHALLLTGDADGAAEPLGVDTDVLQVAHHGSQNAARDAFLRDATPQIALVSAGRNSYGHPHPETMRRLDESGAQIYTTQEGGAITVYFSPRSIRVEEFIR